MLPEQKRAWFTVGVGAVSLVAFLVLIPLVGIERAPAGFGLFGLVGLTPLMFRKKDDPDEVIQDERDTMIAQKALFGAGLVAFQAVVWGCMVPWFVYMFQGKQVVSIHALPMILFTVAFVYWGTNAIALVVLYGREQGHVED